MDFAEGVPRNKGAGGAATNEAERVEMRIAFLRRNLSGREDGRKLMMASKARSVAGRELDPPSTPPTRARRRRLKEEDADDEEFEKAEEEEEIEEAAEGAGEG